MYQLPGFVLPMIIVTSALGALIMCALVIRYGFTVDAADDEESKFASRRVFFTRLGHAGAAVCFAVSGMLAVVALFAHWRSAPAPVAATRTPAAVHDELLDREERLKDELNRLAQRVSESEARTRDMGNKPTNGRAPLDQAEVDNRLADEHRILQPQPAPSRSVDREVRRELPRDSRRTASPPLPERRPSPPPSTTARGDTPYRPQTSPLSSSEQPGDAQPVSALPAAASRSGNDPGMAPPPPRPPAAVDEPRVQAPPVIARNEPPRLEPPPMPPRPQAAPAPGTGSRPVSPPANAPVPGDRRVESDDYPELADRFRERVSRDAREVQAAARDGWRALRRQWDEAAEEFRKWSQNR